MEAIIKSEGFESTAHYVPPFVLNRGEYLSLNFHQAHEFEEEIQIRKILGGIEKLPSVNLSDLVISVSGNFKYPFFANFFKSKKAFSLLKEKTNLTDKQIHGALEQIGIKSIEKVYSLGFSEKMLLQLEVAYSKSKNIIISTSGLDYTGINKVRQRVLKELSEGSVIELNYLSSKGREYLVTEEHTAKRKLIDVRIKEGVA